MGRPSDYSEEVVALICERLGEHGSLAAAIAADEAGELPGERTIYRWLAQHEDFRQAYTRAREVADEPMADEMLATARDQSIPADQKRILVDTMKWQLARRSAKKWGDKVDLTHQGGLTLHVVTGVPDADADD